MILKGGLDSYNVHNRDYKCELSGSVGTSAYILNVSCPVAVKFKVASTSLLLGYAWQIACAAQIGINEMYGKQNPG